MQNAVNDFERKIHNYENENENENFSINYVNSNKPKKKKMSIIDLTSTIVNDGK